MKKFLLLAAAALATIPLLGADNLSDSTVTQTGPSKLPAKVRATAIGNAVYVPQATIAAKAASGLDQHVPAAATAAIVSYTAGGAGISHVITGIQYSYSAAPTGGRLTVLNGAARSVTDGVTATDTSLTSATGAFTSADVGATVSGTGVTVGTRISTVTNSTTVVLDRATTASATGVTIAITPMVLDIDITAAGPGFVTFNPPKSFTANKALTVTLASGAGSVVGKLTVLGHYTEQQ